MEYTEAQKRLTGHYAKLDGEPVVVEVVYSDDRASVRRLEGEHAGTVIICSVDQITDVED